MDNKKLSVKVREVICNILIVRNYIVADKNGFINSDDEIFLTKKIGDSSDRIYIFYPKINIKIGVSLIRKYIDIMTENEVKNAIIVVKDSVTAFARQLFDSVTGDIKIQCFSIDNLLFDITKHTLVPKHTLLSTNEKNELLETYKIKDVQLPKICTSDPVVKHFGAKKGDIFRITRHSESCGENYYYRIVT